MQTPLSPRCHQKNGTKAHHQDLRHQQCQKKKKKRPEPTEAEGGALLKAPAPGSTGASEVEVVKPRVPERPKEEQPEKKDGLEPKDGVTRKKRTATDLLVLTRLFGT